MKKIVLIGGGGHCKACIDVIEQQGKFSIQGIVDRAELAGQTLMGYPYIGSDDDLPEIVKHIPYALITVGQIRSVDLRKKLTQKAINAGFELPVVLSPYAYVSQSAQIGPGSIVMHQALVNSAAKIGAHCIINSQALIEHDVTVDEFCHISTGAKVNGGTQIGSGCFIGSGVVIKHGLTITDNVVIGANSTVLKHLMVANCYYGVV